MRTNLRVRCYMTNIEIRKHSTDPSDFINHAIYELHASILKFNRNNTDADFTFILLRPAFRPLHDLMFSVLD